MLNIPSVESPFFEEHFPTEGTNPELLHVARSLHEEGFAVVDFPDDSFAARVEEIIGNLGDRFDWDDRGMHLTPETPTYSMRGCGGLPADAGGV